MESHNQNTESLPFEPTRESILDLWGKVKERRLADPDLMEAFYARIILDHESMLMTEVDSIESPLTHEFDPNNGVNPFLHILLHGLVEAQVRDKSPIETVQFSNAMKKQGLGVHRTQHLLCSIFFPLILEGNKAGHEPDMARYAVLLKKYKGRTPEKIEKSLENDMGIFVS